jgi:hypothetical protein
MVAGHGVRSLGRSRAIAALPPCHRLQNCAREAPPPSPGSSRDASLRLWGLGPRPRGAVGREAGCDDREAGARRMRGDEPGAGWRSTEPSRASHSVPRERGSRCPRGAAGGVEERRGDVASAGSPSLLRSARARTAPSCVRFRADSTPRRVPSGARREDRGHESDGVGSRRRIHGPCLLPRAHIPTPAPNRWRPARPRSTQPASRPMGGFTLAPVARRAPATPQAPRLASPAHARGNR